MRLVIDTATRHAVVALGSSTAVRASIVREVVPAIEAGRIVPVIDRRFPLAEIADAHRHLEANANVGKVLIDL